MNVITMERLTKRFGDDTAVDAITLAVAPGTIVGIIGPSGAGKTTLVRLLTGALAPTDGEVRVMGEDPLRFRRETRERIGYMPQSFALYPDLTTRENVDFVASLFGLLWWRRRRRTQEVLKWVDLWDVRSRRAGRLSGLRRRWSTTPRSRSSTSRRPGSIPCCGSRSGRSWGGSEMPGARYS